MIFVPWQLGQWRACMIMTSLDRKGVALTLIYPERIADPTPLIHPPRAQVDMLALDFLSICLPNRVLLRHHMPLVGPPPVGEIARDTKRLQQRFECQKDRVLPSSKHIG